VNGSCLGLCPVGGCGISSVELLCYATIELVPCYQFTATAGYRDCHLRFFSTWLLDMEYSYKYKYIEYAVMDR
jgi:hypothetical protein